MIVLVGLLGALTLKAESIDRVKMLDYIPVEHMNYAFEVKTSKFEKVILDCQSFITGMNFYNNKKVVHSIYLDAYGDCQNMHNFLMESKNSNIPVCLEVEGESRTLTVSNEDDCQ
jgi:hypothetical protein